MEEDGLEVHSSMYENLVTNAPKPTIEIPEFLFPEDGPELSGHPRW